MRPPGGHRAGGEGLRFEALVNKLAEDAQEAQTITPQSKTRASSCVYDLATPHAGAGHSIGHDTRAGYRQGGAYVFRTAI